MADLSARMHCTNRTVVTVPPQIHATPAYFAFKPRTLASTRYKLAARLAVMSSFATSWHGFVTSNPLTQSRTVPCRYRASFVQLHSSLQISQNVTAATSRHAQQEASGMCKANRGGMFAKSSHVRPTRRHTCQPCSATNKVTDAGWEGIAGSVGVGIIWAALAVYGFILSPNQTPYRDMYFLEKLVGIGADDGVKVNIVFSNLCFLMGVWPAIFQSLLLPSAKSGNKVPAWPFVVGSFAFGYFALGPFFALWTPINDDHMGRRGPPKKSELKGWKSWGVQVTELPVTSWLLLASACWFVFRAGTAGGAQWAAYSKLFDESRFCHVTTIDFLALTASAPVWMWNDAEMRQWEGRKTLLPVLASIPLLGPALYLVVRPKAR